MLAEYAATEQIVNLNLRAVAQHVQRAITQVRSAS
jgi:hypothetical protein